MIAEELPGHPAGVLAGPNLAREVLDGHSAAAVVRHARRRRSPGRCRRCFRANCSASTGAPTCVGAELGGALKNVFAIAAGMADGLGIGDNTRALVIAPRPGRDDPAGRGDGRRPGRSPGWPAWAT